MLRGAAHRKDRDSRESEKGAQLPRSALGAERALDGPMPLAASAADLARNLSEWLNISAVRELLSRTAVHGHSARIDPSGPRACDTKPSQSSDMGAEVGKACRAAAGQPSTHPMSNGHSETRTVRHVTTTRYDGDAPRHLHTTPRTGLCLARAGARHAGRSLPSPSPPPHAPRSR